MENLMFLIFIAPVLLFSVTIHEYAHGLAAQALGDPTPKLSGRMTLNPLKHIDPVGLLMLILVRFGWAKPVPVNPSYFADPDKDMALVSLAGPFSNFAFAVVVSLVYKVIPVPAAGAGQFVSALFQYTIWINLALGIFNLLPIPPLDGSRLIRAVLPYEAASFMDSIEPYGFFILIFFLLFPGTSEIIMSIVNYFAAFLI